MLNDIKTTCSKAIVSFTPIPPSQQHPVRSISSLFSYAIGPIDRAHLITMHMHLSTGETGILLVPTSLPASLLTHPTVQDGAEWGYLEGNPEEEQWTVFTLVNKLYRNLTDQDCEQNPDFFLWTLGLYLGLLARLAEHDRPLALTGLAHYGFLFSLLTQNRPADWPRYEAYHVRFVHRRVMKAYRARVSGYREQGKSFYDAQRFALIVNA